jgi:hypothetical protein
VVYFVRFAALFLAALRTYDSSVLSVPRLLELVKNDIAKHQAKLSSDVRTLHDSLKPYIRKQTGELGEQMDIIISAGFDQVSGDSQSVRAT